MTTVVKDPDIRGHEFEATIHGWHMTVYIHTDSAGDSRNASIHHWWVHDRFTQEQADDVYYDEFVTSECVLFILGPYPWEENL